MKLPGQKQNGRHGQYDEPKPLPAVYAAALKPEQFGDIGHGCAFGKQIAEAVVQHKCDEYAHRQKCDQFYHRLESNGCYQALVVFVGV